MLALPPAGVTVNEPQNRESLFEGAEESIIIWWLSFTVISRRRMRWRRRVVVVVADVGREEKFRIKPNL